MTEANKDSFHFARRIPQLLFDGLSIESTRDFVLLVIGLALTTFFLESLNRVSRELLRKVPRPSRTEPEDASHPQLVRQRSDRVPLTNSPGSSAEEAVPCVASEGNNGYISGGHRVGLQEECCYEDAQDHEMASLVDKPACCQTTAEMTEEQRTARLEKTWKSLSLHSLPDRWEMLQTTCEEEGRGAKRISHSYRVLFHLLQTLLGVGQSIIGYTLMLVIMYNNAWLLIVVVGGAGLGYLVFSSDLERVYANYAECYVKRKIMEEEEAKRKCCESKDDCCDVTSPTAREHQSETVC